MLSVPVRAASHRPPPLPPKSSERPLDSALNSSLANEVEIVEEPGKLEEKRAVRFKKAVSEGSAASLKRPYHKRRSSGEKISNPIVSNHSTDSIKLSTNVHNFFKNF